MRIYGLMRIRYHIGCMYGLIRIYGLTRIRYHIFRLYIISHVLAISHVLTDFRSHTYLRTSDLPCDVTQYGSNAVYLSLYSLYDLYGLYNLYGLQSLELIYSSRCNSNINVLSSFLCLYYFHIFMFFLFVFIESSSSFLAHHPPQYLCSPKTYRLIPSYPL